MNKALILSIITVIFASCTTEELSNSTTSNNQTTSPAVTGQEIVNNNEELAKTMNSTTEIVVSNTTRGFSSAIIVKDSKITKTSTGVVPPTTTQISTENWTICKQKFAKLNLVKISTYVAPSCLRCADMDVSQTLEIKYNGVVYTSNSYDSTNPPAALKDFLFFIKKLN